MTREEKSEWKNKYQKRMEMTEKDEERGKRRQRRRKKKKKK